MKVKAIAAMDKNRVIGLNNSLPWEDVPEDLKHFSRLTKGHTVLMGRKTFDSLPEQFKPLPKRKNIVVTRSPGEQTQVEAVTYIQEPNTFINDCKSGAIPLQSDTLWVIGGAKIYELTLPLWDELHLTLIKGEYMGDTYFPQFEEEFELASEEELEPCIFRHYVRKSR